MLQIIQPQLHLDGATLGCVVARLRGHMGTADDPIRALNRLPFQCWTVCTGIVDEVIDLAGLWLGCGWAPGTTGRCPSSCS